MNREMRRARAAVSRSLQSGRPTRLTQVDKSRWPPTSEAKAPIQVWESREFLVQVYPAFRSDAMLRLSVCRTTYRTDGRNDDRITWEELQRVKREVGYGEYYAVEVYPRDSDIVNDANMRHLWVYADPPKCGWFPNGRRLS